MPSTEPALASARSERLVSLDVFRGITIAGMILVNNPGSWSRVYPPLRHATWHGWTPTDLVFPFFLFIVGVAMAFSFGKRAAQRQGTALRVAHVLRRTVVLFLLGLIMGGFTNWRLIGPYVLVIVGLGFLFADEPVLSWPSAGRIRARKAVAGLALVGGVLWFVLDFAWFQESSIRVPGVLQRIALCYFIASIIVMICGTRGRVLCVLGLLIGYWVIVANVSAPAGYSADLEGPGGLLHDWIDAALLGDHLYRHRPDPEGLLSTLPAVATTLLGVLTGSWLRSGRDRTEKVVGMFMMANLAVFAGWCMGHWFPINKKIWTSSYVVLTAGLALHFLAMCYYWIDVRGRRRWCFPFVVFGTNPILVFFASGLVAVTMARCRFATADGGLISLKTWIYRNLFVSWAGELNGSLAYALAYITLWCLLLVPLYRRRIFIKI
ncbi:MAG: DUF5009 domain-containing protein [bacterium]|nr:DUF5009 domain-containing protein [bacterium]